MNKTKALIIILIVGLILLNGCVNDGVRPTKAEVERFFEENSCEQSGIGTQCDETHGCTYYLRRHSTLLAGQISSVPKGSGLFVNTPFHYYHEIAHGFDNLCTYTWVDTREGRFVYNAVNGEYVKEIDDKEDPAMKYLQEQRDYLQKMRDGFEKREK